MLYRETGQFKTSYQSDQAVFPILQDRIGIVIIVVAAYALAFAHNDFLLNAIMIPFLIFALAAIGLNILTGYTGLLSLGSGAFMGVGAYACYKLTTIFPNVNILIWIICSGFFSALVGVAFGVPSLRIKGFYLAIATLAAQFFLEWCFTRIAWLYNYNVSGAIEVPQRELFGVIVTGPRAAASTRYLIVLTIIIAMTWIASNLVRGRIGRMWMAVRDMDIAAELMGIRMLPTKLLAFAISSFYCGVAGALLVFLWYGSAEFHRVLDQPELHHPVHDHHRRARQPARLVPRRRADLHPADRAQIRADRARHPAGACHRRAPDIHAGGRADCVFPDRRTAWPGKALADRQTEIEGVAVSLLIVQNRVQRPEVNVRPHQSRGGTR